uniref:Uncharacterized protein n=1 Tax=Odontella aurita TaxID=265563 RepID=A0A7S4IXM8_9STRA|mmetsp:Transcript_32112/g.96223  ORF Transcript_32112/g.96223 Transcript_32112/m.96223 type:complete len:528 (+) Transcript_32112:112-1695(+)
MTCGPYARAIILLSLSYVAVFLSSLWAFRVELSAGAGRNGVPPPPQIGVPNGQTIRRDDAFHGDGSSSPNPNPATSPGGDYVHIKRGHGISGAPTVSANDRSSGGTAVATIPLSDRRFPSYGSSAFDRVCGYADRAGSEENGCHIYVTVDPHSNEGVSAWAAQVASGFLYAVQMGCSVKVDYGHWKRDRGNYVSVPEVLSPIHFGADAKSALGGESLAADGSKIGGRSRRVLDWTAPPEFRCISKYCMRLREGGMVDPAARVKAEERLLREKRLEHPLAVVPRYRFAYNGGSHTIRRGDFENVTAALPGFEIETGMACAWNRLFRLASTASKYRPDLFTRIWPALHRNDTFVIALYVRTRHADRAARLKKEGKEITAKDDDIRFLKSYELVVNCASQLEERNVLSEQGNTLFSQSAWLVVTDSPKLAQYIASNYDTTNNTSFGRNVGNSSSILPRRVVTTASRGVHSKPQNGPNTSDFADGFIDWYLVGESDAVISHGALSFGSTAALRSARPLYDSECNKRTLVAA